MAGLKGIQFTTNSREQLLQVQIESPKKKLLRYVINGNQPAAERLLSKHPGKNLATMPLEIIKAGKVLFNGTALQFAAANLDLHMCIRLIKKGNIHKSTIAKQLIGIKDSEYARQVNNNLEKMLRCITEYMKIIIHEGNDFAANKETKALILEIKKRLIYCPAHVLQKIRNHYWRFDNIDILIKQIECFKILINTLKEKIELFVEHYCESTARELSSSKLKAS